MIAAVITHLWQSTLFAAAAGLLTLPFRGNRAQVRHALWMTASLKFFIPFAILIGFGSHLSWAPAARKIATPAVSFAVEYVAQPISFEPPAISKPSRDWTPFIVAAIWSIGFLAIAIIRLRLWLRVRSSVRESKPLEIASTVQIREAEGLLEPGVVGIWRPTLLLPEGIMDRLTPSELEAVIAHELCHIRRHDNLLSAIHMAVEALFWFHPLVWWIGARLLEERERACDESVLSLGNQPRVYADAILSVCKLYTESPLVCVCGVTGSDIKRRIEIIMRNRIGLRLNAAKKLLLAGAGLAAVAAPVAVGILIAVGHLPAIHAQTSVPGPAASLSRQPRLDTFQLARPAAGTPATPATAGSLFSGPAMTYQNRRLVAMLFDIGGMTTDDQAKVRQSAIQYIENSLTPNDLVCVMNAAPLAVLQDFTDDKNVLESAIQKIVAGAGNSDTKTFSADRSEFDIFNVDKRLATVETAAKMLAAFPEKKVLMYFSSGITEAGENNQTPLRGAVNIAKQANVAIYPIDARGTADLPLNASAGAGRGSIAIAKPAGLSQDEYNRRIAEAEQKFGSASGELARTYIMYGPPDRADIRFLPYAQPGSQIWRYNYLPNFHSNVEFEFTPTKGNNPAWRKTINYPSPLATYTGIPAEATALVDEIHQEDQRRGQSLTATTLEGLPGRHTTIGVYVAGELAKLSVPLDGLSGTIDIIAQVKSRSTTGTESQYATSRDYVKIIGTPQPGMYETGFMFQSGSYICRILVREAETSRTFTEAISFEVP